MYMLSRCTIAMAGLEELRVPSSKSRRRAGSSLKAATDDLDADSPSFQEKLKV
jgi:hypothetical protein